MSHRLCLNSPLVCPAAVCQGISSAVVQAVGLCRSHSHSLLACLTNFPPVDPVLGLWPNSGLGRSGDVPVFDIHRSTAASAILQATVKPCSLQIHQRSPCNIAPVLKTPGMEWEKVIISMLPPAQTCFLQYFTYT